MLFKFFTHLKIFLVTKIKKFNNFNKKKEILFLKKRKNFSNRKNFSQTEKFFSQLDAPVLIKELGVLLIRKKNC